MRTTGEVSLSIEIRRQPVTGPPLVRDYLSGVPGAVAFYAGRHDDLETLRSRARTVMERFGPEERRSAAAALSPTSERARERLERFIHDGGIMVTTGQQAGLLTGPLYTLYKAMTAARLAETLEARLGITVLPVFWTASEDHDWAEVNHAYLALERDGIRRIQLPDDPPHPVPMSDVLLADGARMVVDELSDLLSSGGDNETLFEWIRTAYRPDVSVSTAFTELLGRLLAQFDFCMTEASHPAVKRASAGVLLEALERSGAHEQVLRERTEAIEAAGYHAQVAVLEAGTNVFRQGPAGRERLYAVDGGFRAAGDGPVLSPEQVRDELSSEPGRYSPNVFLRPVVESTVFPTVAYVGGPGEISYFAQVSALFPSFGIEPPVVYPRASLLLLELPMRRLLEKLDVEPETLAAQRHELIARLAEESMPESVRSTLDELAHGVTEGYRTLIEEARQIDPTLEGALARLRNEALTRVSDSEKKITQHIKRKESVRIGQLDRLLAHLRPEGKPQDRVLNAIPFLARHGLSLLDRMYAEVRAEVG